MKKILLVVFTALLIFVGVAMADFKDHPRHGQISSFSTSIVGTLTGLQNAYFVQNQRYFQGLWLLGDVLPDGTVEEDAINTRKPTDQEDTWATFGPALFKPGLTVPVNLKIDVYKHTDGWGWILTAEFYYDGLGPDAYGMYGNHWMYQHHVGPRNIAGVFDEWHIFDGLPWPH